MLDQLRHQSAVISLEAASGDNAVLSAISRLPNFFTAAQTTFQKLLGANSGIGPIMLGFWRSNNPADYAQMRHMEIAIPPGLAVDYLTYVEQLEKIAKEAIHVRPHVIEPFAAWLGERLGNPASLSAITPNLSIPGLKLLTIDKYQKQLDKCFSANARAESVTTYAKVIQRNADWTKVNDLYNSIGGLFSENEHAAIVRSVNDMSELLGQLTVRVEQNRELYKLSAAALTSLSNTTYAVAQQLEFYGLLRFRHVELGKALADADQKLRSFVNH